MREKILVRFPITQNRKDKAGGEEFKDGLKWNRGR